MSLQGRPFPATTDRPRLGVRIAGTGSVLPPTKLTNADLERLMDTSDEWIVQRTGIHERRRLDPARGETLEAMAAEALGRAMTDAGVRPAEVDLLIVATVSTPMTCPSLACRVAPLAGLGNAGAFDLTAACSGFVYGLNIGHEMIRSGAYRTVAVVGAEMLTQFMDYTTDGRGVAILFGDAAGAAVLRATDDPAKGIIAQAMHADGGRWHDLYVPKDLDRDCPSGADRTHVKLNVMQMNGREVFKFAVGTFQTLIDETLQKAGLDASDVDMFVCHQSNARILQAARERFGIPEEKMYVNIDRVGNTSAASVPLCLDELRRAGRVREGHTVMFVAFGAGLTWSASLWQL